ncbi:hypothetical protein ABTL42_19285, partial [Acinetobacter baumannii]
KFGGDGSAVVIGMDDKRFFHYDFFNKVEALHQDLKKIKDVQEVLSIPEALKLEKDTIHQQFIAKKIFNFPYTNQAALNSDVNTFKNLIFY